MANRLWLNDGLLLDCTSLRSRLVQIDLPGHAARSEGELGSPSHGGVIHGSPDSTPGRVLIAPHEIPPSEVNQTPLDINGWAKCREPTIPTRPS